jgi:N-acetylmuramoyl-L-alanine amidase
METLVRHQLDLATLEYWSEGVTGRSHARLRDAAKEFQGIHGLKADGIIGPKTEAALRAAVGTRLQLLVLHCSATREGVPVSAAAIVRYHLQNRGWSRPGYSDIIELDGRLVNVRAYDDDDNVSPWEVTNGMLGQFNRNARHVCYVGGIDANKKAKDTRTAGQLATMQKYILDHIERHPAIVIIGHNAVQRKGCPCFNVPDYLRSIGVPERNIGSFRLY